MKKWLHILNFSAIFQTLSVRFLIKKNHIKKTQVKLNDVSTALRSFSSSMLMVKINKNRRGVNNFARIQSFRTLTLALNLFIKKQFVSEEVAGGSYRSQRVGLAIQWSRIRVPL